jgi:uncharacterized membrane protein
VGELIRALQKTYIINAKTKQDVAEMWVGLSKIRALLPVQMSQEEEELMRERLWKLVNNHTILPASRFNSCFAHSRKRNGCYDKYTW